MWIFSLIVSSEAVNSCPYIVHRWGRKRSVADIFVCFSFPKITFVHFGAELFANDVIAMTCTSSVQPARIGVQQEQVLEKVEAVRGALQSDSLPRLEHDAAVLGSVAASERIRRKNAVVFKPGRHFPNFGEVICFPVGVCCTCFRYRPGLNISFLLFQTNFVLFCCFHHMLMRCSLSHCIDFQCLPCCVVRSDVRVIVLTSYRFIPFQTCITWDKQRRILVSSSTLCLLTFLR